MTVFCLICVLNGGKFMKKLFMFCFSTLLFLATLTGCGGTDNGNNTTPQPAAQEITVAVASQFTTLDTGLNTETVNSRILKHTAPALFAKATSGEMVPVLAESYTVSEDGLCYTIKLKEGIVWSDDVPFTAEHLEFAVLRNLTYGADNAWATYDLQTYLVDAAPYAGKSDIDPTTLKIKGVNVVDDHTIEYHLVKPCSFFLNVLGTNVFKPLRPDFIENNSSTWAMTPGYPTLGAYSVAEVNANEKCVLVKNPKYFEADQVNIEKITFLVMIDADAQALAFKTGEIDIATAVSPETALNYKNNIVDVMDISAYFMAINSGPTGPDYMQNVNVRRALALAIDKIAMTEVIGADFYKPLNGYIPNGITGISGDFRDEQDAIKTYLDYDPEEAKALLAAEGYDQANPLKIKYKYSNTQLHSDVAQIAQQMWKAIGVECELEPVEGGVFYGQLDEGLFEIARYGYSAGDDPVRFLALWTQAIQVVPAVADEYYDEQVDQAAYLVDRTEYMTKMHELEEYLVEEMVYVIPLFNYVAPYLQKDYISNVRFAGGDVPDYSGAVIADH